MEIIFERFRLFLNKYIYFFPMLNVFIYILLLAMFLLTERFFGFFILPNLAKRGIFQPALSVTGTASPEFQETLRRILSAENSTQPSNRILAPPFSNVEKEKVSLFYHQKRIATTRNQHQQHRPRLRANPYTQNSTGLQSSFSSLTGAARGRFVYLSSSLLIYLAKRFCYLQLTSFIS